MSVGIAQEGWTHIRSGPRSNVYVELEFELFPNSKRLARLNEPRTVWSLARARKRWRCAVCTNAIQKGEDSWRPITEYGGVLRCDRICARCLAKRITGKRLHPLIPEDPRTGGYPLPRPVECAEGK